MKVGKCPNCDEWMSNDAFKDQRKRARKSLFKPIPLYCPHCGKEFTFSKPTFLLGFLSLIACIGYLFTDTIVAYIPFALAFLCYLSCRFGNGLIKKISKTE